MSDVLKRADAALYEAKRDGRGTIRFAAGERAPATGQLTLTARMRRALARGEFELHYQPVWDVASGEAVAVEALLRWNDPERGMIPPGDFIPAAEDSGLIEPIGDWVVDAVIAQAAAWGELGLRPDIAFNVSPRQLRSTGFAERLLARFDGRRRGPVHRRDHRVGGDGRPRAHGAAARAPQRGRAAAGDRRLRRRLLLARPAARPAGARAQDRPLVPARRPRATTARRRSSPRSCSSPRRSS